MILFASCNWFVQCAIRTTTNISTNRNNIFLFILESSEVWAFLFRSQLKKTVILTPFIWFSRAETPIRGSYFKVPTCLFRVVSKPMFGPFSGFMVAKWIGLQVVWVRYTQYIEGFLLMFPILSCDVQKQSFHLLLSAECWKFITGLRVL